MERINACGWLSCLLICYPPSTSSCLSTSTPFDDWSNFVVRLQRVGNVDVTHRQAKYRRIVANFVEFCVLCKRATTDRRALHRSSSRRSTLRRSSSKKQPLHGSSQRSNPCIGHPQTSLTFFQMEPWTLTYHRIYARSKISRFYSKRCTKKSHNVLYSNVTFASSETYTQRTPSHFKPW